jgi:hypothetical protein
LSFGKDSQETIQRQLPYLVGSLICFAKIFVVCDSSGVLHALDTSLSDLADPLPIADQLDDLSLIAKEGYVYLAHSRGVFAVDLVAWLRSPRKATVVCLHSGRALSCMSTSGDIVSIVASGEQSDRLMVWKGMTLTAQIPIPGLSRDFYTFPPILCSRVAYVTQRSRDSIFVCDLNDRSTTVGRAGGSCLYATAWQERIACLVESNGTKRVVEFTKNGTAFLVPTVPIDTTWFLAGTSPDLYMWGNGSSLTLVKAGRQRLMKESGNIGVPALADGQAIAIAQDGMSTEAILIDLSTGAVGHTGRIGDFGFSDIACSNSRLVAGNGQILKSFSAVAI